MERTRRLVDDRTRIQHDSRREIKFRLDDDTGQEIARAMESEGILALSPSGQKRWAVCTTYFDVSDLRLVARAHANPGDCVKVRTREYLVGDPTISPQRIWLEIKRRFGDRTEKTRFPVVRSALEVILGADLDLARKAGLDRDCLEALTALAKLSDGHPFKTVAEVRYWRRAAFHTDIDRVTLDDSLSWRLLGQGLECSTGPHTGSETGLFLEIKGEMIPSWLASAIGTLRTREFSKFEIATRNLMRASSTRDE